MAETSVLVTGACGEIGQALVRALAEQGNCRIVTTDLLPLPDSLQPFSREHIQGDLVNKVKIFYDYDFDVIFHLAASLSSKAEVATEEAHRINVEGTMQLLMLAAYKSEKRGRAVKFLFPSSIAVYGLPDLATKRSAGKVKEDEWNTPHTMYGCNKLYCEKLGMYYRHYYSPRHLDPQPPAMLDFRALRFPGLISAFTVPSGGTSDYGPEMLHRAAEGKPYACFVRADTRLPFMAMPDAIRALLQLTAAPREALRHVVYNVTSFSLTAEEFRQRALRAFPGAEITFAPQPRRQGIVDSWPEEVDDSLARLEWGWAPAYDVERFFREYLLPNIRHRYGWGDSRARTHE
jgi:threonine 3-dehydrogenase